MYQLPGLEKFPELVCACSDKSDGNMSFNWGERETVLKNRNAFLGKLGVKLEDSVAMFLKHGTEIAFADESSRGEEAMEVDCLMTRSKKVFLFVLTGDCLPIIFYDPVQKLIGLAHISRINTPLIFVKKIVGRFKKEGSRPENIVVGIGPGVRKESYLFDRDELRERTAKHDSWKDFLVSLPASPKLQRGEPYGKTGIDLVGYTIHQLVSAGIPRKNIEVAEIDTITNENFFSHYRSWHTGESEGRMATAVGFVK